jgi:hypothetical protein
MFEVHTDLKPLSANLKRINIGEYISKKDFNYLVEENNLDEFWELSKTEWSKTGRLFMTESPNRKYTESFIIGLNTAYHHYIELKNTKAKESFNIFLKLGLIFFVENKNVNIDKILNLLDSMEIVNKQTVKEIRQVNDTIKENIQSNSKIVAEMNLVKKYQIFISSTFVDLIEERQAAVEAILQKGHIPAGMELFSANDKSQWEVIKKWIDDSDIYLLLLGGRYGTINEETGISYTQMEYDYATSISKPLFTLILSDEIIDAKPREISKDYDLKDPKYKAFKSLVSAKMCSFPKNNDQIKLNINQSLDGLINEYKEVLIGWIRGNLKQIDDKKKSEIVSNKRSPPIFINETSTEFFSYRLSKAFPGDRGIRWYDGKEAVKRLSIFFNTQLIFKTNPKFQNVRHEDSPVSDPIWWFRGSSSMYIEEFEVLSDTKILVDGTEYEINRIAVNVDNSYYKSYIYVEAKGEDPIGFTNYTTVKINQQIDYFGYASEQYGLFEIQIVTHPEYEDGSAVINGEIIEIPDAKSRKRFLSNYNFIITAKQSPYNSTRFQRESKDFFNEILKEIIDPEDFFKSLESYNKHEN